MRPHSVKELLQLLGAMAEAEIFMSELYRACAQEWEKESQFWLSLSKEEVKHSENVRKLADIISERVGHQRDFQFHRPFTLNSVRSFVSGIRDNSEEVTQGNISEKRMLAIALDIERSLLERKYSELIKTDDVEYQTISMSIDTETNIHRDRIEKKLKEYNI